MKDFIMTKKVANPFGAGTIDQNNNLGEVRQKGFELEYFYAFDSGLTFDANYTRLLLEDKEDKENVTNAPKDKVSLSLSYELLKDLTTNVNMQYASKMHSSNLKNETFKDVGGSSIWNAKVAYDITKSLTVDLGASNIFDKNYDLDYGYPEAGRVVYSNLTYKF